jgi:hypothetical protein
VNARMNQAAPSCRASLVQLDLLSRDAHFISGLIARKTPVLVAELGPDVEPFRLRGLVTLPCGEREVSAPQELSGCYDGGARRVHRSGAKHAARLG